MLGCSFFTRRRERVSYSHLNVSYAHLNVSYAHLNVAGVTVPRISGEMPDISNHGAFAPIIRARSREILFVTLGKHVLFRALALGLPTRDS